MASVTQTKRTMIGCFVCSSKDVTTFKLNSRKLKQEIFSDKFKSIFVYESCLYDDLFKYDAAICRNCHLTFCNLNDFVSKVKDSMKSVLQNSQVKRGMLSPMTPKSTETLMSEESMRLVLSKSRKMLKLSEGVCG
jgi:hypothetical protein